MTEQGFIAAEEAEKNLKVLGAGVLMGPPPVPPLKAGSIRINTPEGSYHDRDGVMYDRNNNPVAHINYQTGVMTPMKTLTFNEIAAEAGFSPEADGKLNLPATQDVADALAIASLALLGGEWKPGDERVAVTLTGAGPVWGYLAIAHALHGRVTALHYEAPNASIKVFGHGE